MYPYRQPKRQSLEGKPDTGPLITLNTLTLRRILFHHVALQPPTPIVTVTVTVKLMKPVKNQNHFEGIS